MSLCHRLGLAPWGKIVSPNPSTPPEGEKMAFMELLSDDLRKEHDEIALIEDSDEWLKRHLAWFRKALKYHSKKK